MIQNKKLFGIATILLLISIVVSFPYFEENPYGEEMIEAFGFSIMTVSGLNILALIGFIIFLASTYFLFISLKKYQFRSMLVAILIIVFIPSALVNLYQRTIATGIYALHYNEDQSYCEYETVDTSTMHAICELPFKNYSNKDVAFQIEFYGHYRSNGVGINSVMQHNQPYDAVVHANGQRNIRIEMDITLSEEDINFDSGSSTSVPVIIKSGDNERKL
ncbi:hypothetical protein [Radiobacillus sp. PE A8.2]|uniref:hypothetical protein n=1 Tax=Radiobacillus sp. PE A8.2 TaxID=3380349 RepID=UPI00388E91B1